MTGIVNPEAFGTLEDKLCGLPILENWFAIQTMDDKVVMKIWVSNKARKELEKNPKVKQVISPYTIKAHSAEEAYEKFKEKINHHPNFDGFDKFRGKKSV